MVIYTQIFCTQEIAIDVTDRRERRLTASWLVKDYREMPHSGKHSLNGGNNRENMTFLV